ncbi:MAG TPA: hypothetical protein VM187_00895 [Niastella sp.]|nr:hypothetical protein [Niastella sp.]
MKSLALFISVLLALTGYSQKTINNYKYVLVPERFGIFKSDNQYGLNTMTKLLLEDKGFTVYMDNSQLPAQLAGNKCNALKAELEDKKGFFVTSVILVLKDCQGNVVFRSKEGKSREKEWPTAYDEALREAYSSLKSLPYQYDSTAEAAPQPIAAAAPAQVAPQTSPAPATNPAPVAAAVTDFTGTLYAQPTANGFQLIDTTPKRVLTLLKTSIPDHFIAEGANGVVFKKDGEWIFEYYKDGKLVSQKFTIKF